MNDKELEYIVRLIFKNQPWPIDRSNIPLNMSSISNSPSNILSIEQKTLNDDIFFELNDNIDEKSIQQSLLSNYLIRQREINGISHIEPNEFNPEIQNIRQKISEVIYKYKFGPIIQNKLIGSEFRIIATLLCYNSRGENQINYSNLIKKAQIRRESLDDYIRFWDQYNIIKISIKNPESDKKVQQKYYSLNLDSIEKQELVFQFERSIFGYHKWFNNFGSDPLISFSFARFVNALFSNMPDIYFEKMVQLNKINAQKGIVINRQDIQKKLFGIIGDIDPLFHSIIIEMQDILKISEPTIAIYNRILRIKEFLIQNFSDVLYGIYQDIAIYFNFKYTLL